MSEHPILGSLVADLEPVRPLRFRNGMLIVAAALVATLLAVAVATEFWPDALRGLASAFFYLTNALLLGLGLVAAASVVTMASPRVGNAHRKPVGLLIATLALPIAAIAAAFVPLDHRSDIAHQYGTECALLGAAFGALVFVALVAWLRRGAPVTHAIAGWHTGIAAGALGSFAYGLSCPIDGIEHLGFYHVAPVLVVALVGRTVVPPIVRF